jgi:thiamine-triphosphatase
MNNKVDNTNDISCWELKKGRVVATSTTNSRTHQSDSVTVYQEMTGHDAIQEVVNIFFQNTVVASSTTTDEKDTADSAIYNIPSKEIIQQMDGYDIPKIPESLQAFDIQPFARIQTTRYQWKMESPSSLESMKQKMNVEGSWTGMSDFWNTTIKVDMDVTDFGYAVGEVEAVVNSVDQVNHAKEVVEQIVSRIISVVVGGGGGDDNANVDAPVLGKLETYLLRNQPHVYAQCVSAGVMKKTRNNGTVGNE